MQEAPAAIGSTPRPRTLIGPAPPPAQRPVVGPQLPPTRPPSAPAEADEGEGKGEVEEADELGPVPASSLTSAEAAALAELQRVRQQAATTRAAIATLRSTHTSASSSHEEWMTQAPPSLTSHSALLAAATGDRAMRPRGFSHRASLQGGDSGDWTASPEEREWRRMEREAERDAQRALQRAMKAREDAERERGRGRGGGGGRERQSAPSPAAEVSGGEAGGEGPSLVELHQRAVQAERERVGGGSAVSRVGPIFWDRDKEMGMRRQKTQTQITAEMRGARGLLDRFASSTS